VNSEDRTPLRWPFEEPKRVGGWSKDRAAIDWQCSAESGGRMLGRDVRQGACPEIDEADVL
jgi:hypothetical protein